MELPPNATVDQLLDVNRFRQFIALESGQLPDPPVLTMSNLPIEKLEIPGLNYVENFLDENEEQEILNKVNNCDWSEELQRRVQHYGWRYDYKSRKVDSNMWLGPLPDWAKAIAQRLVYENYIPYLPDQLIVNEYKGEQGIAPHIDSKSSFADGIVMISLLESWEMTFRKRRSKRKLNRMLKRRSAMILTGEARYLWAHEIPKRKTEPGDIKPGNKKPTRVPRGCRISLTFRKVITNNAS